MERGRDDSGAKTRSLEVASPDSRLSYRIRSAPIRLIRYRHVTCHTSLLILAFLSAGPRSFAEMAMARAEIDSIANFGGVHNYEEVLPWRQALLIRQLGCGRYSCRALARDELTGMGHEAFEALCWGYRSRDPEIRDAAGGLLERLYDCPRGCPRWFYRGDNDYGIMWDYGCLKCRGTGSIARYFNWNDGAPVPVDRAIEKGR